jgi:hypothetical protein
MANHAHCVAFREMKVPMSDTIEAIQEFLDSHVIFITRKCFLVSNATIVLCNSRNTLR